MKFIYSIFLLFLCFWTNCVFAIYGNYDEFSLTQIEEKKETERNIKKGSIFRGYLAQNISSEYNNSGDIVKVLITSDYTIDNVIILPKNSLFVGQIENLSKAQRGRDGFFSIAISQLQLPDGRYYPVKGYIAAAKNGKIFGGAFSKRSKYKTTVHRGTPVATKGVLYLQQNGPRIMGDETKLTTGEFVTIVIEEGINFN